MKDLLTKKLNLNKSLNKLNKKLLFNLKNLLKRKMSSYSIKTCHCSKLKKRIKIKHLKMLMKSVKAMNKMDLWVLLKKKKRRKRRLKRRMMILLLQLILLLLREISLKKFLNQHLIPILMEIEKLQELLM